MKMSHNELAADLANHIRQRSGRIVWTDMQLGPSGSPRPDVYTIEPSFTKFCPMAYEIKVSVADYRRDVTAGKWQSYLPFAAGVTFAVPAGLIEKSQLPEGCGLMVRSAEGWRTVKAPTLRAIATLPHAAWVKLFIDGMGREVGRRIAAAAPPNRDEWLLQRKIGEKLGDQVRQILQDRNTAENRFESETQRLDEAARGMSEEVRRAVKRAQERARDEASQVDAARSILAKALGLPSDAHIGQITRAAYDQVERLDRDSEVHRLRMALRRVSDTLNSELGGVPVAEAFKDAA